MADQLWTRSATELASLIASGDVSSREVVDAHLDRIDAVNPELNAITVHMADDARAAADRADGAEPSGPLHGVPFTIKENIDQVGFATTQAVAAFAEAKPTTNAPTVQRMLDAGAIPIGRTNMPELGLRVSTDNALRGLTRNPWSHDHTAGGSSGGEGSAIAAGMSPIGLGNDIGGSIRNPALCCGVAGLKPGYGRIPRATTIAPTEPGVSGQLMAVEGPMARTIADLRLGYEILSGSTPVDPRVVDAPIDGPPMAKRCGVVRDLGASTIGVGALAAVDDAAAALSDAGWEVVEIEVPDLAATHDVWLRMLAFDFSEALPLLATIMGEQEISVLRTLVAEAESRPGSAPQLFMERMRLQKLWSQVFANTPVVVGPGWNNPPFRHGDDLVEGEQMSILDDQLSFIVPANALGLPAVAMKTGEHDSLPTGVQIYANQQREDRCLSAAAVIENANGVIRPIDPVWA